MEMALLADSQENETLKPAVLSLKLSRCPQGCTRGTASQTPENKDLTILFLLVGCEQIQAESCLAASRFLDVQPSQQPRQEVQFFFGQRAGDCALLQKQQRAHRSGYQGDEDCNNFPVF